MEIQKKVNLAEFTTYKTGGKAEFFCKAKNRDDLNKALLFGCKKRLPIFILGGGSNILVSDSGFNGLLILNRMDKINYFKGTLIAESGLMLPKLVLETAEKGLSGLEFLAGIPGTVGGAVAGNAGAWGKSIWEKIRRIEVSDFSGEVFDIFPQKSDYGYRQSIIQKKELIVLAVEFDLVEKKSPVIKKSIANFIKKKGVQPKGMTCGSFFKNPPGKYAGEIIEKLGFKGREYGGAKVSDKHGNFILNSGKATSLDIYKLAKEIKQAAKAKLGITLIEEVKYLGNFE